LDGAFELKSPPGIAVEGPPVRVWSHREVTWRIRPERAASGKLEWNLGGATLQKSVAAGDTSGWLSRKRTRSLAALALHPTEARLPAGPVGWVEVDYPSAEVAIFGREAHWLVW